jgi:aryl-alcohol dehydrogenase-like predicted oxidoreductase
MQKRILGKTGLEVSVLGFGGIVLNEMEQRDANNLVAEVVDRGINFFDVGPTYGNAQERLGPALEPYRNRVVLACKTEPDQSKEEVWADIRNSLKLLKTDYFDIYQLHAADTPEHLEKALGPGGALEAIIEAREQGLVRYIGFSSHYEESAIKLMKQFDFDTVIFPINWSCWLSTGFGRKVLEEAEKRNLGRLAIKALALRNWNEDEDKGKTWYKPINENRELAKLALKFTLSRSVNITISPGDPEMLKIGLDIVEEVKEFGGLDEEELNILKKYSKEIKQLSFE